MKACLFALFLFAGTTAALEQPATHAGPCASDSHRQFDFWVGEWDVTQNGAPAGHNRIEVIHDGCVVAEHWTSATSGFTGSSLNMYDAATDRWHQTWMDNSGTLLELNGHFDAGKMVMTGSRPGKDGGTVRHRITWTQNDDGTVRQHWQTSADGAAWTTLFDGRYVLSPIPE